jgi:hypothetical protein
LGLARGKVGKQGGEVSAGETPVERLGSGVPVALEHVERAGELSEVGEVVGLLL